MTSSRQKRKRESNDHYEMIPNDPNRSVHHHHGDTVPTSHLAGIGSNDDDIIEAALLLVSLPHVFSSPSSVATCSEYNQRYFDKKIKSPKFCQQIAKIQLCRPVDPSSSVQDLSISYQIGTQYPLQRNDTTPHLSPSNSVNSPQSASTLNNTSLLTAGTFHGSFSLYTPRDDDVLSPIHCFIRKYGIEAFVATEEDKKNVKFWESRNFKLKPGLVAMRCKYCKGDPLKKRASRSMHYPSSMNCIYNSMENWQRYHAFECKRVPASIKEELTTHINQSRHYAGGRRSYWCESAIKLGMMNVNNGVVLASDPRLMLSNTSTQHEIGTPLVDPADEGTVSTYLFTLMSQMERCTFTEKDITGNRSQVKSHEIGFPGFQCKYCQGAKGMGRYFPTNIQNFKLPNTNRNVKNHLLKCSRCPTHIKETIKAVEGEKSARGTKKKFLEKIWKRIHSVEPQSNDRIDVQFMYEDHDTLTSYCV